MHIIFTFVNVFLVCNIPEILAQLKAGRANVCVDTWYVRETYTTKCSFWKWGRCTRRRTAPRYTIRCCAGWRQYSQYDEGCDYAICDDKIRQYACTLYYSSDFIKTRPWPGLIQRNSGGECASPEVCQNCNDGFYSTGPHCQICPKIEHCLHRKCTSSHDVVCKFCDGEIKPKKHWRAYTSDWDAGKTCQKTCSWRTSSTRCYPGTCADELASNCQCVAGFTGTHCEKMTDPPEILYNEAKLTDGSRVLTNPKDPNNVENPQETVWTNNPYLSTAHAEFHGKYVINEMPPDLADPSGENHYVTAWDYGIISGSMKFNLYRGNTLQNYWTYICREGSLTSPKKTNYICATTMYLTASVPFQHGDRLEFVAEASNGGYVDVMNREFYDLVSRHYFEGKTITKQYTYKWDRVNPYHCVETSSTCSEPVTTPGLTEHPNIDFTWSQWNDDLSLLKFYQYELYDLGHDGVLLSETQGTKVAGPTDIDIAKSVHSITLPSPGMYSLHFSAFDTAGNWKTSRAVLLFDDQSVVEEDNDKATIVTSASLTTGHTWVIQDINYVHVDWKDRFINKRHTNNLWLNRVEPSVHIDEKYDDKYGERTISLIDNVHGCVDYQFSYQLYDKSLKQAGTFTSVSNIHDQSTVINNLNWEDGDKLVVTVRALDVFGKSSNDTVTVFRDTTPPIIKDLWLTRGNRLNISVHSLEELNEMTFEWEAYDFHSGIDTINWKLYDNYTGQDTSILHGLEHLPAQGLAKNITECEQLYFSYPRGHNCYCTPFQGCYHRHFQVKPRIAVGAGLIAGKDRGVHDSDYYIEVTTTNLAQLTTTKILKITIDKSPPAVGHVEDGIKGQPEVDYQQSKTINAHWEGFFDRESGVKFYQYAVNETCLNAADFNLDEVGQGVFEETFSTYVTQTVSSEGKYYVTVVAYNHAYEASIPVCSDGLVVDTSTPIIREVTIDNAKVRRGLVTDAGRSNVWVVSSDRTRRIVRDPPGDCVMNATVVSDIELLPIERDKNGNTVEVNATQFCFNTSGAPNVLSPVLSKLFMMDVSWLVEDSPSGIHDYRLGLSSTVSTSAPDIFPLTSTKQHAHYMVHHADVPDGSVFYIVIETTSKANVKSLKHVGPCILDTTVPQVDTNAVIAVHLTGDHLVATWNVNTFIDGEEPYYLDYTFAVGHWSKSSDVQKFKSLQEGPGCILTDPPTCTAVNVSNMNWYLHGHHSYYITIRVVNTAGLVSAKTSRAYVHDVQLPSEGVVFDIKPENAEVFNIPFIDIEDVDFTTNTTDLTFRWSGFAHPHLPVTYKISISTSKGGTDVLQSKDVGNSTYHKETGLTLQLLQTYYATVEALTDAGSINVSTDGITIVKANAALSGITINDGENCTFEDANGTMLTHHNTERRMLCETNIDYQMSLNSLKAYWSVPENMQYYTPDVYFQIEEKAQFGNFWSSVTDYEYISTENKVSVDSLTLDPGRYYRFVVKFCARETCFAPLRSDGVLILANPPQTGSFVLEHMNTTENKDRVEVVLDRFYDPDIVDTNLKFDAIDHYEWTLTDNSHNGHIHTKWTSVDNYEIIANKMKFNISLDGILDFSRCRRIAVRGYNRAKLWSLVSGEIKDCKAFDPILVKPNVVIDAVGLPAINSDGTIKDGYGKQIFLALNDKWKYEDIDYTPYKNILSAVWPNLRHRNYKWAVLDASEVIDAATFYLPAQDLQLSDPCSHTDSIKCGLTTKEYINVEFNDGFLQHGRRYIVCIHADKSTVHHEKWDEELVEVNTCSDGVVIDLTPPIKGRVWIGQSPEQRYQTSTTNMYVTWDTFRDVEEYGNSPHDTGVKEYILGIGSSANGNDIFAFRSIGVTNHYAVHNLMLQNGHSYYATIQAMDFANRTTSVVSEPVTVDHSPPIKSNEPIRIKGRHLTSLSMVEACWINVFSDAESGIKNYEWSVGSHPGYNDIMPYSVVTTDCASSDAAAPLLLQEGHAYYINVKANNGAGLSSLATSWAFTVDITPPVAGHVYDGNGSTSDIKDIDYQTDISALYSHWEGFHDAHSAIKDFYFYVGTCPECDNILLRQAIGITKEFTLNHIHLTTGLRYYVTVTACNTADLCTTVTSDGVILDNSPPSPGVVMDGTGQIDIEYQSIRSHVGAKWHGFTDPQSGICYYEWKIGLSPGSDGIYPTTRLFLSEGATVGPPHIQQLPVGKRIYVTVTATNNAGLSSESTSSGFIIDDTAPDVTKPVLGQQWSLVTGTIVSRTSFGISWTAGDAESYIQRQYLSIDSHIGGEFNLSSIQLNGIVRDYIFTGLQLHDGVCYFVTLIVCNGAKLCTDVTSDSICVDSTPPTRGMFAIETNHAANLHRHVDSSMFGMGDFLYLSWLGFSDIHTEVDYYMVTIGSTYMASNLNAVPGTAQTFYHTNASIDNGDEGYLQLVTLDISGLADNIFVSVWAVNKNGLRSAIIHSKFRMVPGGALELIRRCDAYSCNGHCVCAPQDQTCPSSQVLTPCIDLTNNNPNNIISVVDVLTFGDNTDVDFTSSNTVLMASWSIIHAKGLPPLWYEWSVGWTHEPEPEGVFDTVTERVWYDAGQNMNVVFTTKPGIYLKEGLKYSVFVRIWYTKDTFAVFKSDGVVIATYPPSTTKIRGSAVVESTIGTKSKDQDYIRRNYPIRIQWTNKFLHQENVIKEFKVYISTFPGGHDVYTVDTPISGTADHYDFVRYSLPPDKKYFSNVVAYSYSGLHTTETSDGFILDDTLPKIGTVHDGIGLNDVGFQNNTEIFGAHWNGFKDLISGISSYSWKVIVDSASDVLIPWTNVGLHTSVSRIINDTSLNLQGKTIYSQVVVLDNAGLESLVATSNGVVLDVTPPVPQHYFHSDVNILQNPSFEDIPGSPLTWEDFDQNDICLSGDDSMYHPSQWTVKDGACVAVIYSSKNIAKNGRNIVFVRGTISNNLKNLEIGLYRITFVTSHLSFENSVIANKEGFVTIGDQQHVFMMYTKGYRKDDHNVNTEREIISWHNHTFYFRCNESEMFFSIGSMDETTGILIDDVRIQKVEIDNIKDGSKHAHAHVVFLHDWSSIHGSWKFTDPESPIIDYTWAIGYREGGTQIQGFTSTGTRNFAYNNEVTLVHNSFIYVTVIATNAAGLRGISYSDPILIDLTPPVISKLIDGLVADDDARQLNEVSAKWTAEDLESGIDFCEWAIGFQPHSNELQAFTLVPSGLTSMSRDFSYSLVEFKRVFVTIKCQNKAGVQSSESSDGVVISREKSSIASVQLIPLPLSATVYSSRDGYQSVSDSLRMKWTGFVDNVGIEKYKVTVTDASSLKIVEETLYAENQDYMYVHIHGLNLAEGTVDISVQAINNLYLESDYVTSNITTSYSQPSINDPANNIHVAFNQQSRALTVSWNNVFPDTSYPKFYEVSAGRVPGGADIIQWQETKSKSIVFSLPDSITDESDLSVYIYIRCFTASGVNVGVKKNIKITFN